MASARDGADGGRGGIGAAAYSIKQFGVAGRAAVIDGQFIIVFLCRDAARQLDLVACWGGQHEGAVAITAVVSFIAAVVIHLERLYARWDGGCLDARLGHVDIETIGGSLGTGERRGDGDCRAGHDEGCLIVAVPPS